MAAPLPQLPEQLDLWHTSLGWQPTAQQQAQFQALYDLTMTANRQFNLTRITAPIEFWEKHLWDSLSVQPMLATALLDRLPLSPPTTVIDIGTGAGFPGLPLAIVHPSWTVTLLDATRKKVNFLQQVVVDLALTNVKTWVDRAEQIGHHSAHRGHYDVATIRAVATAPVCAEYALPLLKVGGLAILYRGQWTVAEAEELMTAVALLGGEVAATTSFNTPVTQSIRHCLYLRKLTETPIAFPRAIGIPSQWPLA